MAVYPTNIKQFTTKRDQIDIDYAADINALQDEVRAIEMALGINPMVANLNSGLLNYPTVAARLDALEKGESALQTEINKIPVTAPTPPPTVTNVSVAVAKVNTVYALLTANSDQAMNLSNVVWDSMGGQANGVGITIQRSGYYFTEGGALWFLGTRSGAIQFAQIKTQTGQEIAANSAPFIQQSSTAPTEQRIWCGGVNKLSAGTQLRLWLTNSGNSNVGIMYATLQTYFLSEG